MSRYSYYPKLQVRFNLPQNAALWRRRSANTNWEHWGTRAPHPTPARGTQLDGPGLPEDNAVLLPPGGVPQHLPGTRSARASRPSGPARRCHPGPGLRAQLCVPPETLPSGTKTRMVTGSHRVFLLAPKCKDNGKSARGPLIINAQVAFANTESRRESLPSAPTALRAPSSQRHCPVWLLVLQDS